MLGPDALTLLQTDALRPTVRLSDLVSDAATSTGKHSDTSMFCHWDTPTDPRNSTL
jgi:hypothetical protein